MSKKYEDLVKKHDAWNKEDYETALREWKPLAEQGDADAQSKLGWIYARGKGVQDYSLAHMWWNVAASQGDKNAKNNRDIVEKKMSPTQIETAQRLANECVKKKYKGC